MIEATALLKTLALFLFWGLADLVLGIVWISLILGLISIIIKWGFDE